MTAKETVKKLLDEIPDDASLEDIQYHLYVLERIERGLKESDEGQLLPEAEMDEWFARWLGE